MNSSLNTLTLTGALEGLQAKQFSSVELVSSCLEQIAHHDSHLHAFITLNQKATDAAIKADAEIAKSVSNAFKSKPLLGIPIALKDNFLTQDLQTTASSKVLEGYIPPFNATVVNKLIASGAIIIGKTNMDAWAHGSSTETSDFGPTYNPWNVNHLPGGSSGGSAAAVAADACIAAIGSETAGSIRQPAAWTGITGLKPTYGRVSRYGVVAMASSTDSPGPMTKTVADSLLLLNQIAGFDPHDATTINLPFKLNLEDLNRPLKGMRLGLPDTYLLPEMDKQVIAIIREAAVEFERLGATIIPIDLMDPHYSIGVYTVLQRSEVSSNLGRYDGIRYGHDRSFFGEEAKRRMMLGTFSLSTGYYDEYYKKAQKVRTLIVEDFNAAFEKVDAIIGPTSPGPALKIGASKDQPMFGEMEDILVEASSIAGLTGINVPCGFVSGLPIGLQITGPQQAEALVLNIAHQYQQATSWHLQKPILP
jgi:aspartyl-tRNA(Asn)/glutamyl-tRNA(Gln) amidotransferase subunit A